MKNIVRSALLLSLTMLGCSNADPGPGPIGSTCDGPKCDAFAPPELVATPGDFGRCTVVPDTEAADLFFARDLVDCLFVGFDESTSLSVTTIYVNGEYGDGRIGNAVEFAPDELGTSKTAVNARAESYPLTVHVRPILQYLSRDSGKLGAEPTRQLSYLSPKLSFEVATRPTEPVDTNIVLPLEVWPVVVWPTQAFADRWETDELRFLNLTITDTVEFEPGREQRTYFSRHASSGDSLESLPGTVFALSVDGQGEGPQLKVMLDSDEAVTTLTIDGPGYYLLGVDGSVTRATPAEVEALGMFDRDAPPVEPTEPDAPTTPEPTEPSTPEIPPDPCGDTCDATQACVAGACVALSDQVQRSCTSTPTAACDGEDTDCGPGNACVGGVCRLLSCQVQNTSCYTPTASCDGEDSDCGEGHACSGGLCRRLTCQIQNTSCYTPTAVCEASSDCAGEHACVAGTCRRLTCQIQNSSCYTPTAICAADADCGADHACAAGVCRRLTCQVQNASCYTPTAVCDAEDTDCGEGHTCNDSGVCQRLTCQ